MSELLKLADRVEALAGPCQKSDEDICRATGWRFVREGHPFGCVWYNPQNRAACVPAYTSSLDAAMTLYPELPKWVPSCPRLATVEAPRAIAAGRP